MIISNFHDDATHREALDVEQLVSMAEPAGLRCLQRGYISVPYLEDALMAQGHAWQDAELLLYGYWSRTRWAQFAVFERMPAPGGVNDRPPSGSLSPEGGSSSCNR